MRLQSGTKPSSRTCRTGSGDGEGSPEIGLVAGAFLGWGEVRHHCEGDDGQPARAEALQPAGTGQLVDRLGQAAAAIRRRTSPARSGRPGYHDGQRDGLGGGDRCARTPRAPSPSASAWSTFRRSLGSTRRSIWLATLLHGMHRCRPRCRSASAIRTGRFCSGSAPKAESGTRRVLHHGRTGTPRHPVRLRWRRHLRRVGSVVKAGRCEGGQVAEAARVAGIDSCDYPSSRGCWDTTSAPHLNFGRG